MYLSYYSVFFFIPFVTAVFNLHLDLKYFDLKLLFMLFSGILKVGFLGLRWESK